MKRGGVLSLWRGLIRPPEPPIVTLAGLAEDVAYERGCTVELLRGRRMWTHLVAARRDFAERAIRAGYSGAAAARFLCRDPSTINGALPRRREARA